MADDTVKGPAWAKGCVYCYGGGCNECAPSAEPPFEDRLKWELRSLSKYPPIALDEKAADALEDRGLVVFTEWGNPNTPRVGESTRRFQLTDAGWALLAEHTSTIAAEAAREEFERTEKAMQDALAGFTRRPAPPRTPPSLPRVADVLSVVPDRTPYAVDDADHLVRDIAERWRQSFFFAKLPTIVQPDPHMMIAEAFFRPEFKGATLKPREVSPMRRLAKLLTGYGAPVPRIPPAPRVQDPPRRVRTKQWPWQRRLNKLRAMQRERKARKGVERVLAKVLPALVVPPVERWKDA